MGYVVKLIVIAMGLTAIYGITTGADLNELFSNVMSQALPVAKQVFAGLSDFVTEALKETDKL